MSFFKNQPFIENAKRPATAELISCETAKKMSNKGCLKTVLF